MKKEGLMVMIDQRCSDHQLLEMVFDDMNLSFELLHFEDCDHAIGRLGQPCFSMVDYVFIHIHHPDKCKENCLEKLYKLRLLAGAKIVIYIPQITLEVVEDFQRIGIDKFIEKTDSRNDLREQLVLLLLRA